MAGARWPEEPDESVTGIVVTVGLDDVVNVDGHARKFKMLPKICNLGENGPLSGVRPSTASRILGELPVAGGILSGGEKKGSEK